MKKIVLVFILLVLLLVLCACGNNTEISNTNNRGKSDMQEIKLVEIEWAGIDWEQIEFPIDPKKIEISIDAKSITTKEDAIKIGEAITKKCGENDRLFSYKLLAIVHSTQDNIWRFDYSIDQRNKDTDDLLDCGGFHVAIDGNSCEIIKMWVEE